MVSPHHLLPGNVSPAEASLVGAWQTDRPVPLTRHVQRLTAPNPGVMTGPGTNSYLVGEPATGYTVIDPGPADPDHLQRLWQAALFDDGSGGNILRIVCTHSHPDHAPGAPPLQALCHGGPPILGLPSLPTSRAASEFSPDRALSNHELLTHVLPALDAENTPQPAHTLRVLFTPGHAANHVCLLLEDEGLLFSGDHILNGSTTVIDPPDGNMHDYLNSLDALSAACTDHAVRYILPAHGHVMDGALEAIAKLKAHRLRRETKVAAAMQALPLAGLDEWLPLAYDDVEPLLWPLAKRSLLAHVERIYALANPTGRP
jgi:glyoxylase-like metal-dependent hydrolase (beta-lactamase superfamily II)